MARSFMLHLFLASFCLIASLAEAQQKTAPGGDDLCSIQAIDLRSLPQVDVILIQTDRPVERRHDFFLEDPKRLVLDLHGCIYPGKSWPAERAGAFVRKLRFGRHQDKVRIVADLSEDAEIQHYISEDKGELAIYLGSPGLTFIEDIHAETGAEGLKHGRTAQRNIPTDLPRTSLASTSFPAKKHLLGDLRGSLEEATQEHELLGQRAQDQEIRLAQEATDSEEGPENQWEAEPNEESQQQATIEAPWDEEAQEEPQAEDPEEVPWEKEGSEEIPWEEGASEDTLEELEEPSPLSFYGKLWNKFAHDTKENNKYEDDLYNHVELILGAEYALNQQLQAVLSGEFDYFAYRKRGDWKHEEDLRFHNTYINWAASRFNLRVGNQIVKWGKTDEVSPLDIVNPEDLKDGFVRSREERKLPIPMLNLELYANPFTLQGIYIPFFKESKLDFRGTDWSLFQHVQDQIGAFEINEEDPSNTLANSEVGVRFSGTFRNLDYALSYLYSREDLPSPAAGFLPPGAPSASGSTTLKDYAQFAQDTNQPIRLVYDHQSIFGLEFETVWRDFGIRGDFAYIHRRRFLTDDVKDVKRSVFEYVLGADYNGPASFYVNFQFSQAFILDHDDKIALAIGMNTDAIDTRINGEVTKGILDDNLELSIQYYYSLTGSNYYYNPKVIVKYWESIDIELGADIVGGPSDTTLGWFGDNDQIYAILRGQF